MENSCNLPDSSNLTNDCSNENSEENSSKNDFPSEQILRKINNDEEDERKSAIVFETSVSNEKLKKNSSMLFVVNTNPQVLNKDEIVNFPNFPNSKFHENSKSHVCPFKNCGKVFKEKGNLKNHIRAHVRNFYFFN